MPPEHTLIIEGHITSSISNTTRQRIDRHLRHCIITSCGDANIMIIECHITSSISNTTRQRIDRHLRHCILTSWGDANVMMGSKHIDPALCIYIGAYLICIDN
jgi:hypothetical protein